MYYRASSRQLKGVFGWFTKKKHEKDEHLNVEAWRAVTESGKQFQVGRSRDLEIKEPRFFYFQRLVSYTILAKDNGSQKISLSDMEVVCRFFYEKMVDYMSALKNHWLKVKPTGKLAIGGMVTYCLNGMHDTVLIPEFLTMENMKKMRGIKIFKDGKALWCYEGFAAAHAAVQEGSLQTDQAGVQGRALGRHRTRAQTRTTTQRANSTTNAPVEHLWMDPQVMRRWRLNVEGL